MFLHWLEVVRVAVVVIKAVVVKAVRVMMVGEVSGGCVVMLVVVVGW